MARLALLALLLLAPAEAQAGWLKDMMSALARGASHGVGEGEPAAVFGHYRVGEGTIRVWRGPTKMRTLVHELLHKTTASRPGTYEQELRNLTGVLQLDEGLTSYFAEKAVQSAGLDAGFPEPAPGASFATRRAWALDLRKQARQAILQSFGKEVSTDKVHVLSDEPFRRTYERGSSRIWIKPKTQASYVEQQQIVRQLVDLAGEGPVRHAYFSGDVGPLREALRQKKASLPRKSFPGWIDVGPGR